MKKKIPAGDIFLPLFALEYPYRSHFRYEMTSKSILEQSGLYDPGIPIWVDWDLRLRLASKYKFGYCHYVGSAYTQNPHGLTSILKQETILNNLKFVISKNINALKKYPAPLARKALHEINLVVWKLSLAVDSFKGKPSIFRTLRFLWYYPGQLMDIRFILNSMFGNKFIRKLSVLKKKIRRKKYSLV